MTEALLLAKNSQIIATAFIKKLAALKDNLEVVAVAIKTYKENNKERGTIQLKRRAMDMLAKARKQFAYLCRILDMERAEL